MTIPGGLKDKWMKIEFCRAILNSPLLRRRRNKSRSRTSADSSDDEGLQHRQSTPHRMPSGSPQRSSGDDEAPAGGGGGDSCYQNLETFQKHQLKQKVSVVHLGATHKLSLHNF